MYLKRTNQKLLEIEFAFNKDKECSFQLTHFIFTKITTCTAVVSIILYILFMTSAKLPNKGNNLPILL